MKYCNNCGNELRTDAKFCDKCGSKVESVKPEYQQEELSKIKPKKKNTNKFWLFFIFGIIALFIYINVTKENSFKTSTSRSSKHTSKREKRYAYKKINIRDGRGRNFKLVGHLERGDEIEIDSLQNNWVIVYKNDKKKGYVYSDLLKSEPIPPFEIVSWNWYADPSFGNDGAVIWNVQVRNNTNKYVSNLKVKFTTYDASGNIIDNEFTYVSGLSPGGTSSAKSYATYFGREEKAGIKIDTSSIY